MAIILEKKRPLVVLFLVAFIALRMTAQKCREIVGEKASSKSGQFSFISCFDMSTGTLACAAEEGVKFYFYNLQTAHVERSKNLAIEATLADAATQGLNVKKAAKQARKEGEKAAKLATRQADRIMGPLVSCGWEFFETIYFSGTIVEAFLTATGTLVGTYSGGFLGEQRLGRVGYLIGSHVGSWAGMRIGLMVYDVVNGVHFLLGGAQIAQDINL